MTASRRTALPPTLAPRGLSRAEAAAYLGISPGLFDRLVQEGKMPRAKRLGERLVWDRFQVDTAFSEIGTSDYRPEPAADAWSDF